ncbi:MAG TPA: MBL fold metallo-hydrolase [Candidatus Binataceae bacterium]|nr:MBL fold metallo-hydrolase [Candidatus Binataceae bacterium]
MNSRQSPRSDPSVRVTILGTGDAFSSHGRFNAGYLIEAGGYRILMEAGPTILASLKRAEIRPADIDLILISHLHGDHFAGLPFLFLEYTYESPRRTRPTIVGPQYLESRTLTLVRTMFPGTAAVQLARDSRWVVIEPGDKRRFGPVRIAAIRTPHMKRYKSLAFRLELGGRTIVFSGDTGWTEDLIPFAAGADLFLCECTYFESAHLDFHLNYPRLERERDRLKVKRMVLTHLGREVLDRGSEVAMEIGSDGMRIEV